MAHHAVCYVGLALAKTDLAEYFAAGDPDIHVESYGDFGIAEARRLSVRAATTPVAAAAQVFVLCVDGLTHEAQNALLKLFEEPPARSQFYLVVPKRGLLLPTLQSRLFFIETTSSATLPETDSAFDEFCQASLGDRLVRVAEMSKGKDVAQIEGLVAGAERLAQKTKDEKLLQCVMLVREYLGRRGASTKMLLEDLALCLPRA